MAREKKTPDPEERSRRPWGSLDREQIVAAALKIARDDGINALSIRRLAAELGASRMALYRHVEDKEALLNLAGDAIAREQNLPLPDAAETDGLPQEEELLKLVYAVRETLRTYPGLAELLLTRGSGSPASLAIADRCIGIMRRAGLDEATATNCYVALFDIVLNRVQREAAAGTLGPEHRLRRQIEAARAADPDEIPHLIEALPSFERLAPEDVARTELEV